MIANKKYLFNETVEFCVAVGTRHEGTSVWCCCIVFIYKVFVNG